MVLPLIGITFPEAATAAESRALLEACDQAFEIGDCVELPLLGDTAPELRAVVEWVSDTEARVSVQRITDSSHDEELIAFAAQDDFIERYRALGFAVGSLGTSFTRSAHADTNSATDPSSTPASETALPDPKNSDPVDPLPPKEDETAAELARYELEVLALVGNGFQNPRFGGGVGAWLPLYQRWAVKLDVGYAQQPRTADGVAFSFYSAELSVGPRFRMGDLILSTSAGAELLHLSGRLQDSTVGRTVLGPSLALHARWPLSRFAPFLAGHVSYFDVTDVTVRDAGGSESHLGQHGPWQFDARVGLSLEL